MRNAMIIDPKDNVAVAIEPIAKGAAAVWAADGKEASVTTLEDITITTSWPPGTSPRASPW